jgi:hypothetical protein
VKGGGIQSLSDGAIDALVDSAEGMTSPYSQILMMPVHGAATRVGERETAVPYREEHLEILHVAAWEPEAADKPLPAVEKHVQWMRQSWKALQPIASQRTYVNFLADDGTARVRAAYGPNYERLVAFKTQYDPDNLFHLNQNIKPDISATAEQ